jgi:hypothetical protein
MWPRTLFRGFTPPSAGAILLANMVQRDQQAVLRDAEFRRGRIECVYLTSFVSASSFLTSVLQYSGVRMHAARSLEEADFLLTVTGGTAFLADVTFFDGCWRDALDMAGLMHPLVGSLIVADPVDCPFLTGIYERGALGVLWRPFDFTREVSMIRTADQAARERCRWLEEIHAPNASHSIAKATC